MLSANTLPSIAQIALTSSSSTVPAGTAVIAGFLSNTAHWFEYLASFVSVCTLAYGGLRVAAAHTPRAQADAWRIILAGIGGLVVALLAPTIVAIVQGMIPS